MRKVSLQHGLPDGVAAVVTSVVVRAETPNAAPVAYLKTWRAGVDGNWDNASKWAHKGVPNALDRVLIAAAGSYTVTVNSADYAQSVVLDNGTATLSIAAGGDLDVEQGLDVQAGTLALAGGGSLGFGTTIEIGQAGTLLDTGAAAIAAASPAGPPPTTTTSNVAEASSISKQLMVLAPISSPRQWLICPAWQAERHHPRVCKSSRFLIALRGQWTS